MSEIKTNAKHLLNSATSIRKKYEEIYKITGENFNIFDICQLERNEDKLHSNLITDLLNPKGRHSMGSVFLNLFLETIDKTSFFKDKKDQDEKLDNLVVKTQKYTDQGIIDIAIESNNKVIIIENKIDAYDQENQLNRYYEWAKTKYEKKDNDKNTIIIYLTKFGESPVESLEEDYIKELGDNYLEISYKDHIKEWIEKCIKEVSLKPGIREALNHYLRTVKKITNQSLSIKEEKEMKELIIENIDNYNSAKAIVENFENANLIVRIKVVREFIDSLLKKFPDLELEKEIDFEELKKTHGSFEIKNNKWNFGNYEDFRINLGFDSESKNISYFAIGLVISTKKEEILNIKENFINNNEKLIKALNIKGRYFTKYQVDNPRWLLWKYILIEIDRYFEDKEYINKYKKEVFEDVQYLFNTFDEFFKIP